MKSETLWDEAPRPKFPSLTTKAAKFDAVVIGGGITGLTAAYLLKQAGKTVCLVERGRIGSVDTGLTTAHLTFVTDLRLPTLVKRFGKEAAQAMWRAGAVAIETIESISETEKIRCDFHRVPGFLMQNLDSKKDEAKELEGDAEAAQELGFPARLASAPYFNRPGVRFANQAKFHPLKYLSGLARAIKGDGSVIHELTEVTEVKDAQTVIANDCKIETGYVVIATHDPLMGKTGTTTAALYQSKIFPYSSYVLGGKVPQGLLPEACFWDTSEPYYYVRVEKGRAYDYVIFGGEDHKTGQVENTEQCFKKLTRALRDFIPEAKPDRQWSGQVIETNDGLPYIGETAPRQFAATGFGGNGMTFGTLAGLMARDAALGKKNPWQELLAFSRTRVRGGTWKYISENLDYPYYYVKDRLFGSDGKSTRVVKRGQGKILSFNGEHVACSRDDAGKLHTVSAICTHMGCLVRWNAAEHTWDCPCHGSRFKIDGEVLAGPAETPLESRSKGKTK
jgi:glycine/D-amino acid oxidase-like deaminating enzyme/nitrite reductase/ring-hydroxylating ferredoxin subunit